MADAKALGGALSYNPFIAPSVQAKLLQAQQQQVMAQALMAQGMKEDDKEHQIGGVAYKVSPLEGLAKMAQVLSGKYQQGQANEDYVNAFQQPAGASGSSSGGATSYLSPQGQGLLNGFPAQVQPLVQAALMNGEYGPALTAAGTFMGPSSYGQANPGWAKAQEAMGTAAAGNMPAGAIPQGMNPMMGNLVRQESGGNPNAVSPAGASGVAQIMPATARDPGFGVQPLQGMTNGDPRTAPVPEQLRFSNDYLNAMQARNGGNPQLAAASYNAGPGAVDRAGVGSSGPQQTISRLPAETQAYVPKVAGAMPSPMPGESQNQYMARLDAAKAGASAQATKLGEATGETTQGVASIDARIDNLNRLLDEMSKDAPSVPYGIMPDTKLALANQFPQTLGHGGKDASAHYRFQQNNENLFTNELPALVKNLGDSRLDIPIVNALKGASQIPMEANPQAKLDAIQALKGNLEAARKSAHLNNANLTGNPSAMTPSADVLAQAKAAIAKGASQQAVMQRLQQNGYDLSGGF